MSISTTTAGVCPGRNPIVLSDQQISEQTAILEAARQIQRIAPASKTLGIPEKTLRDIRFYSADRLTADGTVLTGNGFARAFLKLGRSLFIDIPAFVQIWRSQQPTGSKQ